MSFLSRAHARRCDSAYPVAFVLLGAVLAAVLLPVALAHAQSASSAGAAPVVIPWGDWLAAFLTWARDGFLALAAWAAARFLPAGVRQYVTNEVLAKAVDYAIGAVEGVTKGREIPLPVAGAVITAAENYVVANAPALAAQIGPLLRAKLLARLSAAAPLAPDVTAAKLSASVPFQSGR